MISRVILKDVLTYFLVALFTYTSIQKLLVPWNFQNLLNQIPFVQYAANVLVWAIPVLELITAVLLIFPVLRREGFMLSFIVMGSFSVFILAMLTLSSHLPCSCGGIIEKLSWPQHLLINVLLTIASYWAWVTTPKKYATGKMYSSPI